MKTIQLLLFVLFYRNIQAQTAQQQVSVDSLCHSLDRFSTFEIERQEARDGSRGFITYLVHLGRETRKDSTQLAGKIYLDKEVPMTGCYGFDIDTFTLSGGPIFLLGANFLGDSGMGLDRSFSNSDIMSVHVIGCFNEGVPCCKWDYTEEWGHDPRKEFIKKTEHYKDGLLDGDLGLHQFAKRYQEEKINTLLNLATYQTLIREHTFLDSSSNEMSTDQRDSMIIDIFNYFYSRMFTVYIFDRLHAENPTFGVLPDGTTRYLTGFESGYTRPDQNHIVIFSNVINDMTETLAHELGHALNIQNHTFEEDMFPATPALTFDFESQGGIGKGATYNNVMDYNDVNRNFRGDTFTNRQKDIMIDYLSDGFISHMLRDLNRAYPSEPELLLNRYRDDNALRTDLFRRIEDLFNSAFPLQ